MDVKREKSVRGWRGLLQPKWIVGGIAALAVAVAVLSLGQALPTVPRQGLWLDEAQRSDLVREIRAGGTLVPRDVRWVTAGTAATVQAVLVLPGTAVFADTEILRLANPAVEANLTRAKAARAGAEADFVAKRSQIHAQLLEYKSAVANALAAYEIARAKATAMEQAYAAGAVAKIDLDQARIILEQNKNLLDLARQLEAGFQADLDAPIGAARALRDEAVSLLEIAAQEAEALVVRAGIDGILQQVDVEPGQQVAAGAMLARVAQPAPLMARLQVPEVQAKDLAPGLKVLIDLHGSSAEGAIARIDPAVRNGSVVVDVNISGLLPSGARPDLSVDGRIVLDTISLAVHIARPATAAPLATGQLFVLPVGSDTAQRRLVNFGAASAERIQVLEGIAPGETVVLSDMSRWSDYEAVRLR